MTDLQRNFWLMLAGRAVSKLGDTFHFLALSLMIYAKTESALSVGQVMVASYLPTILLGPFLGVLVDRMDKRKLAITCELIRAGVVLAVPFAPQVAWIYLLTFVAATIGFISSTSQSGLIPQLFPREQLLGYNAKIQSAMQVMAIAGPVLAGIVVGFWSYTAAFVVDSATFLFSASTLMLLTVSANEAVQAEKRKNESNFLAEFCEGARYMMKLPRVLNATAIMFTAMIVGGMFNVLLVVFSKDIIRVTDAQFGWLEAGIGIGLAAGSALLNFAKKIDLLFIVRAGILADALLMAVLGTTDSFYTEWLTLVAIGITSVMAMIAAATVIQTEAEPKYVGRVFSFYQTVYMAGLVGSMMLGGVFEAWFPVRDIFIYGGLATAAATVLLSLKRLPKDVQVKAESQHVQA
jgi:DHA3 family macrolide efflux protein-like MFS transporter